MRLCDTARVTTNISWMLIKKTTFQPDDLNLNKKNKLLYTKWSNSLNTNPSSDPVFALLVGLTKWELTGLYSPTS